VEVLTALVPPFHRVAAAGGFATGCCGAGQGLGWPAFGAAGLGPFSLPLAWGTPGAAGSLEVALALVAPGAAGCCCVCCWFRRLVGPSAVRSLGAICHS
jgi:hypothetical protein